MVPPNSRREAPDSPYWKQRTEYWTLRGSLPPLEMEAKQVDRIRLWLIAAGEQESAVCYDLDAMECHVIDPDRLWCKRRSVPPKNGQQEFWRTLEKSSVWSLPNEESLLHPVAVVDSLWVVVERRLNGRISRVAYNSPWSGSQLEHRFLVEFIEYVQSQLPLKQDGQ